MKLLMKIINCGVIIGIIMIIAAIILHPLGKIILFGKFLEIGEGFYGYAFGGIDDYILLFWGGVILIIPRLLMHIKNNTLLKVFILLGIIFWGYVLFSGELRLIGCH